MSTNDDIQMLTIFPKCAIKYLSMSIAWFNVSSQEIDCGEVYSQNDKNHSITTTFTTPSVAHPREGLRGLWPPLKDEKIENFVTFIRT